MAPVGVRWRLGCSMKPSIGASIAASASYCVPSVGKGKKSRSSWIGRVGRLLARERAQEVHAGLLAAIMCLGGFLPRPAEGAVG